MALKYKHTIILVDDEESITKALRRLFRKDDYQLLTALSGSEGLELLKKVEEPVSLIISDQRMPGMTGSQFLKESKKIFPDAVRFLLTGYSDMEAIIEAVNKGGIHRYLSKPWNDDDLMLQVRQSLEQYELVLENRRLLALTNKQNKELSDLNRHLEQRVNERTLEIRQKNLELKEANKKLEKSFVDTIRLLSALVETLNPRLGRYMSHVAQLARKVAEEYGLADQDLDRIEMAGMVHDIGLLGLPERIWTKEENDMNKAEFEMFKQHPVIAQVCLESVETLNDVRQIVLYHHERYDGHGFPQGLKGDEIPLGSRIISAVAEYCKIVNTWPRETNQIIKRVRGCLGNAATKNFGVREPEEMIIIAAEKIVLVGAHDKYDIEVVTNLAKTIGEIRAVDEGREQKRKEQRLWVELEGLDEAMVLLKTLRLKDGRVLLAQGTKLNKSSIESIQKLGKNHLIKSKVYVSKESV